MERRRVTFEMATRHHALELARAMRPACRAEVQAASGRAPLDAVMRAIAWSRRHGGGAWAGMFDGELLAVFGIGTPSVLASARGAGLPWALTSDAVDRFPREFWRASRAVIATWLEDYAELEQFVDARHVQALRWVARLGFTVEAAQPFGLEGLPFHRIVLRRSPDV